MNVDDAQLPTIWKDAPEWDSMRKFWYWEGQRMRDDGQMRTVRRPLRPYELGSDNRPLPGLQSPSTNSAQPASSVPRYSGPQNLHNLNNQQSGQYNTSYETQGGNQYDRGLTSHQQNTAYSENAWNQQSQALGNYTIDRRGSSQAQDVSVHEQERTWPLNPIQDERASASVYQDSHPTNGQQQHWAPDAQSSGSRHETTGFGELHDDQVWHPTSSHSGRRHHDWKHSKKWSDRDYSHRQEAPTQFDGGFASSDFQTSKSRSGQSGSGRAFVQGGAFTPGPAYSLPIHTLASSQLAMGMSNSPAPLYQDQSARQGLNSSQGGYSLEGPSVGTATSGKLESVSVPHKALRKAPKIPYDKNRVLDPKCTIYDSSCFEVGSVIKVMWFEPRGDSQPKGVRGSRLSGIQQTALKDHKQNCWSGFRRFIIFKNHAGKCNCVPIYSYGGRGCENKIGKHHGIIYESTKPENAQPMASEPELGFRPIRMITSYGEPITAESRVNYYNLTTIEHNTKVIFLGKIEGQDWHIVADAIRSVST